VIGVVDLDASVKDENAVHDTAPEAGEPQMSSILPEHRRKIGNEGVTTDTNQSFSPALDIIPGKRQPGPREVPGATQSSLDTASLRPTLDSAPPTAEPEETKTAGKRAGAPRIANLPALKDVDQKLENLLESLIENRGLLKEENDTHALRKHQLRAYDKLIEHLQEGERNGWYKLPTGTGKTALFVSIARASGLKTLIVVPNTNLVDQTADDEFKEFAPELVEKGLVKKFFGEEKPAEGEKLVEEGGALVTTYQSLPNVAERAQQTGTEFDIVICDECHRSYTDIRQEALEKIPGTLIRLAFSASPDRNERDNAERYYGDCIDSMTLMEAIEPNGPGVPVHPDDRILTGVEVIPIQTSSDISQARIKANGEIDERDLEKEQFFEERIQTMIRILKMPENEGKGFVAYWSSTTQAERAAERLKEAGVSCEADYGDMDSKVRKQNIKDQKQGVIQGVSTMKTLIEGWNSPRTEIAFMCHPTMSAIDAEQRLGRVLRRYDNKEYAVVYEFVDKGKDIVTAMDILEGNTRLGVPQEAIEHDSDGDGREMRERVEAEIELNVFHSFAEKEQYFQTFDASFSTHKDKVSDFLVATQFIPSNELASTCIEIETVAGPRQLPAQAFLDALGEKKAELQGLTLNPEAAEKFAKYAGTQNGWGVNQIEQYIQVRNEVEALGANNIPRVTAELHAELQGTDSSDLAQELKDSIERLEVDLMKEQREQTALRDILSSTIKDQSTPPDMGAFCSMTFTVPKTAGAQETIEVSGRVVLNYLNIHSGEAYTLFAMELMEFQTEDIEQEMLTLDTLAERHRADEPQTPEVRRFATIGLNEVEVRLVRDMYQRSPDATAMQVAQSVLRVIDDWSYEKVSDPEQRVNIIREKGNPPQVHEKSNSPYSPTRTVGVLEYLEGFREARDVAVIPGEELISDKMIYELALAAGYGGKQAERTVNVRNERLATANLQKEGVLDDFVREEFPDLTVVSESRFKRHTFPALIDREISGSTILEYYRTHVDAVHDFDSLVDYLHSEKERVESRAAVKAGLDEVLPEDLSQYSPQKFFAKDFELGDGLTITGEDALAIDGFTPPNRFNFARFVLERSSEVVWYEDTTAFSQILDDTNRACEKQQGREKGSNTKLDFSTNPDNPINQLGVQKPKTRQELAELWEHLQAKKEVEDYQPQDAATQLKGWQREGIFRRFSEAIAKS
jgi:superfamily II DNA or RNA helicase